MKPITVRSKKFSLCCAVFSSAYLLGSNSLAFDYTEGDLLIGLRQPLGNYEMVVNLGQAKALNDYVRLNPGSKFTVTQYSSDMLSSAFSDLGGINWSAFASIVTIGSVEPPYASVWATRPRANFDLKSDNWYGRLAFSQSQASSAIGSIGIGAKSAPGNSSATAVVMDGGVSYGYGARVGPLGDFGGKWLGNVEGATASDFVSAQATNRIDLYYVPPDPTNTKKPGQYLGFFDFAWNGVITFTAATATPTFTGVSPSSGAAGATVTLTGNHFVNGAMVFFGGVKSQTVTVNSATSLMAVVPAHDAGVVNVQVVNPDGQYVTLAGAFTYTGSQPPAQPQILSSKLVGGSLEIVVSSDPNITEVVIGAPTLTTPAANWTTIANNVVGATGLYTNQIPTSAQMQFVRVIIP